jgi:hypothetical protein
MLRVKPIISERILAESSGAPIEVSRKGKAPPLERGRGKTFPTCEPDRVTAEAVKRGNNGFHSTYKSGKSGFIIPFTSTPAFC